MGVAWLARLFPPAVRAMNELTFHRKMKAGLMIAAPVGFWYTLTPKNILNCSLYSVAAAIGDRLYQTEPHRFDDAITHLCIESVREERLGAQYPLLLTAWFTRSSRSIELKKFSLVATPRSWYVTKFRSLLTNFIDLFEFKFKADFGRYGSERHICSHAFNLAHESKIWQDNFFCEESISFGLDSGIL